MNFIADITVMPHEQLLDPQGKAVEMGLKLLDLKGLSSVRVGKHIRLKVEADSEKEAEMLVRKASEQLLANPVMEYFTFKLNQS